LSLGGEAFCATKGSTMKKERRYRRSFFMVIV
jgi:hypothetical protein